MTKALLLTAGFGDGHNQVATALQESFRHRDVEVVVVDCFAGTNPRIARFNEWLYQFLTRYIPWVYGLSYRLTAKLPSNHILWKLLAGFSGPALIDAVNLYQPDIILQLFPDHAVKRLPSTHLKRFLGVVVTDFSVHSRWFHSAADAYFTGNKRMGAPIRELLPDLGIPLLDAGIPIREQFHSRQESSQRMSAAVTAQHPYVVLATGGRGVFPKVEAVLVTILASLPNIHVYVLCGRNEKMLQRVSHLAKTQPRLHGVSFVDNVADWFRGASFAVVKAGGLTVSECLATHTPMLFFRPQPGQEFGNAEFLAHMGAGIVVQTVAELAAVLAAPIEQRILAMKQVCRDMAKPNATDVIVDYVLNHTNET